MTLYGKILFMKEMNYAQITTSCALCPTLWTITNRAVCTCTIANSTIPS